MVHHLSALGDSLDTTGVPFTRGSHVNRMVANMETSGSANPTKVADYSDVALRLWAAIIEEGRVKAVGGGR